MSELKNQTDYLSLSQIFGHIFHVWINHRSDQIIDLKNHIEKSDKIDNCDKAKLIKIMDILLN